MATRTWKRLICVEQEQWRQWEQWKCVPYWMTGEPPPSHAKPPGKSRKNPYLVLGIVKLGAVPAFLLALAALASPVSQATLAPVFGSIPSSVNHKEALIATYLLGYLLQTQLRGRIPRHSGLAFLCVWIYWVPFLHLHLFRFSELLGIVGGPALLGFTSCHMIVIPAVYDAAERFEKLTLRLGYAGRAGSILAAAAGLLYFTLLERFFARWLPELQCFSYAVHSSPGSWSSNLARSLSPVNLQHNMALSLFMAVPPLSILRLLQAPMILHNLVLNPHIDLPGPFTRLNDTLATHNWAIVDRAWSNTGYISILESHDLRHRVLRCDHSLLGGEWLLTDDRRTKEGWKVTEPIYAVFEMLEAVRLMDVTPAIPDSKVRALVVGLGIGTAPKALIQHGINTTVVELDPVVHKFATEYFDLPANHTAVLQDAVSWVSETASSGIERYDYIIHDVFTGGAEPLLLFTLEFLTGLRSLLKSNGVIAINYAGDLNLPLTLLVLNTIRRVFDGQCKIFRDAPPETAQKDGDTSEQDFLNLVVFCRNSPGPITFRKPTRADFLDSKSRQHYLLPRADYEISFPQGIHDTLHAGDEGKWSAQQIESAKRHWHIMRKVLPSAIWELW